MLTYLRRRKRSIPDHATTSRLPHPDPVRARRDAHRVPPHPQAVRPEAFTPVASYGDLAPAYLTLHQSFADGIFEPD